MTDSPRVIVAPPFNPDAAALNLAVRLLRQDHDDFVLRHTHLSATDGDIPAIREALGRLADALSRPAGVGYAVRVTLLDGTTSTRHEDDPFTRREDAERYAGYARLSGKVASAEVVCQQVWQGPWTAAPGPVEEANRG